MRKLVLIPLLCAAFVLAQRINDYRDPDWTYDEGWISLFNGKDLKGWTPVLKPEGGKLKRYLENEVGEQSTFYVEGGLLKTTGTPNGYVRTSDVYDNFVFHVEVRFSQAGNSGVLIYVQRDEVWPKGVECQLYQAHMGRIFPIQGATMDGGEMIHESAKPPGQWNTYEVYSEEGRVATVLNGVLVGLGSNADPKVGYICLQSEGVPAEFRNIKVKRYTPAHHLRPKN
ncbi:MAG: DUF1080 domain-containing protein [Bryobacteraceae bacterium]|nr:DUF1080 domain-containing protein [Bryobacteraceae bacterium]